MGTITTSDCRWHAGVRPQPVCRSQRSASSVCPTTCALNQYPCSCPERSFWKVELEFFPLSDPSMLLLTRQGSLERACWLELSLSHSASSWEAGSVIASDCEWPSFGFRSSPWVALRAASGPHALTGVLRGRGPQVCCPSVLASQERRNPGKNVASFWHQMVWACKLGGQDMPLKGIKPELSFSKWCPRATYIRTTANYPISQDPSLVRSF